MIIPKTNARVLTATAFFCICLSWGRLAPAQTPQMRFDVNDVSWLLPPPKPDAPSAVVAELVSVTDIKNSSGIPVLSEQAFRQFISVVEGEAGVIDEEIRISLPPSVRGNLSPWKIAGIRIDASAPGCSKEIIDEFGSAPQIRLIAHPVEIVNGMVKVHDIALHILFTFASRVKREGKQPLFKADDQAFKAIVDDLKLLKKTCLDNGVDTTGKKLGIHPGLSNPATKQVLQPQLVAFLNKHLGGKTPGALAMMALPNNGVEPWIFVATVALPNGDYFAIPTPGSAVKTETAQMISFLKDSPEVKPSPRSNNLSPPTAAQFVPPEERRGVSTAILFAAGLKKTAKAIVGSDADGNLIFHSEAKNEDIADIVANPARSHFFNTDCISCHTESTRFKLAQLKHGAFEFQAQAGISGLDSSVMPVHPWNVRNFGWFQSSPVLGPAITATATTRTHNETAEVVEFMNRKFFD